MGGRNRKVTTREPGRAVSGQENPKQEQTPERVSPTEAPSPPAPLAEATGDGRHRPVYLVVKGALSTLEGIIDSKRVVEDGNLPGQIRTRYVPGGEATILEWVGRGMVKVKR